jgi:hypothetical protein
MAIKPMMSVAWYKRDATIMTASFQNYLGEITETTPAAHEHGDQNHKPPDQWRRRCEQLQQYSDQG